MAQAHTSIPSDNFGYTIGIGLAQELASSSARLTKQILKKLSGIM